MDQAASIKRSERWILLLNVPPNLYVMPMVRSIIIIAVPIMEDIYMANGIPIACTIEVDGQRAHVLSPGRG